MMYNHVSLKKSHIPVTFLHWSLFVNIYIVNYSQTFLNRTLNKSKSFINRTFNKSQCRMSFLILSIISRTAVYSKHKSCVWFRQDSLYMNY